MIAANGATTEPRIRINRPDDENARYKVSRAWGRHKGHKAFSQCMQQSTTISTSNAISFRQERTEPSQHRRCKRGVKSSPRREPDAPADLLRAQFGVTSHCAPLLNQGLLSSWINPPRLRKRKSLQRRGKRLTTTARIEKACWLYVPTAILGWNFLFGASFSFR
jgi:hypothetical protein